MAGRGSPAESLTSLARIKLFHRDDEIISIYS
jgi:hypothetical protein